MEQHKNCNHVFEKGLCLFCGAVFQASVFGVEPVEVLLHSDPLTQFSIPHAALPPDGHQRGPRPVLMSMYTLAAASTNTFTHSVRDEYPTEINGVRLRWF